MLNQKTVEAYIIKLPAEQQAIAQTLRELVKKCAPQASESIKWAQPVYESNGPFAYIKASKAHVTFGFWRGVQIDGGRGLLESGGDKMAHLKLKKMQDINAKQLGEFIAEAVRLNQVLGNPNQRKEKLS